METLSDIRQLSSGTIATLTGERTYEAIDATRDAFFGWATAEASRGVFYDNWAVAWSSYQEVLEMARQLVCDPAYLAWCAEHDEQVIAALEAEPDDRLVAVVPVAA